MKALQYNVNAIVYNDDLHCILYIIVHCNCTSLCIVIVFHCVLLLYVIVYCYCMSLCIVIVCHCVLLLYLIVYCIPVSYTHLTLPTNREV